MAAYQFQNEDDYQDEEDPDRSTVGLWVGVANDTMIDICVETHVQSSGNEETSACPVQVEGGKVPSESGIIISKIVKEGRQLGQADTVRTKSFSKLAVNSDTRDGLVNKSKLIRITLSKAGDDGTSWSVNVPHKHGIIITQNDGDLEVIPAAGQFHPTNRWQPHNSYQSQSVKSKSGNKKSSCSKDLSWIFDNWRTILKEFLPSVEMANKIIWAIQELNDVEKILEKSIEAFHVIQRHTMRPFSKNDLEMLQGKYLTEQIEDDSNIFDTLSDLLKNNNQDLEESFSENTFVVMEKCWKSVMIKLLPDYPALIEAIETLYDTDQIKLSACSAIRQIKRFSEMGVMNMDQFSYVIEQLSKEPNRNEKLNLLNSLNIENEEVDYFYSLFDVILAQEMPQTMHEKEELMLAIQESLDMIKVDKPLQDFICAKNRLLNLELNLELGSTDDFNWNNDINIEVESLFFNNEVHCLVELIINNSDEKYDFKTIQRINNLLKIAIESVDTLTKRKFTVKTPSSFRGENSGEISVKLTWDKSIIRSFFGGQSLEEENEAAMELIRKVISEMSSDDQNNNLKDKLCTELGIFPPDVDELLEQLTKKDSTEITIELSYGIFSTTTTIKSNIPMWPYMKRKLNDLDASIIIRLSSFCIQEDLPVSIKKELITHLDVFKEDIDLYRKAFEEASIGDEPFNRILYLYRANGGTFGGWLNALEILRDKPGKPTIKAFENEDARKEVFNNIISKTMERYNKEYTRWEKKYRNLPKLVTNLYEFQEQFKLHGISNFNKMCREDLKRNLQEADQIWLFRDQFGGYAHVLFYLGCDVDNHGDQHHYVVHVHGNIGLQTYKGIAKIQEDNLDDVINETDRSFIVRIPNLSLEQKDEIKKKALACVNPDLSPICFSYNGFSGNCESCVNSFYGIWDDELTSQQGKEVSNGSQSCLQKAIAKSLVLFTSRGSDEDLRNKIKERLQQEGLDI